MLIDLKTQQGSQVFKSKNQILFVFVSLSSCLFFLNVSTCLYWCVIYKLCISLSVSLFLSAVNRKLYGIATWKYIYIRAVADAVRILRLVSATEHLIETEIFSVIFGFHRQQCASD